MEFIESVCQFATQQGASDIYLHSGRPPHFKIDFQITTLSEDPITDDILAAFWRKCGVKDNELDQDGIFCSATGERYRVNFFQSLHEKGAILRPIKTTIPALDALGLPTELMTSWISRPSGLLLIAGPTGSGKSTTIASCLEWINQHQTRHILTIEDPIEYWYQPVNSLFTQREVGSDTTSFAEGIKRSLRQAVDVLLLGDIRDGVSATTAVRAAETGRLVIAALPGFSMMDALEHFIELLPSEEKKRVLPVFSRQLIAVFCQKLIPLQTGQQGLLIEYFENHSGTRKLIEEVKLRQLGESLADGNQPSSVSFLNSLVTFIHQGYLSESSAMELASNRHDLRRRIRGIIANSSGAQH